MEQAANIQPSSRRAKRPTLRVAVAVGACGAHKGSMAIASARSEDRCDQWVGGGMAARELTTLFLNVVALASVPTREILASKPNLRLLELSPAAVDAAGPDHVRSILGGLLVQDLDDRPCESDTWTVATQRPPSNQEKRDLEFAWRLVRHVRSIAIVLARDCQSLGIETVSEPGGFCTPRS